MSTKVCPQCESEYDGNLKFCPRDGSSLKPRSGSDLVGQIVAERYHVLRKLGEGGMGQVYLAEHVKMGRKSALKVMSTSLIHDSDAIGRFNREAANASRISHPHVAAIYDFGETSEGLIYLAMEYVDGEPLTRLLGHAGAIPLARTAELVSQIASALDAAHELGIVHRDLKPDNIMIRTNRDGSDCVKVVDFGIAKAIRNDGQKVTRTGLVVGTPEFMSPEQLSGDELDGRSDIYTLGLVTFAMLTGRLPFPSETVQESLIMRLTERPRTLAEVNADVRWPADVQRTMDRALQRKAMDRYAKASDFARDLGRGIAGISAPDDAETQIIPVGVPATAARATPEQGVGHHRRRILGAATTMAVLAVAVIVLRQSAAGSRQVNASAPPPSADSTLHFARQLSPAPDTHRAAGGVERARVRRSLVPIPTGTHRLPSGAAAADSSREAQEAADLDRIGTAFDGSGTAVDSARAASAEQQIVERLPKLRSRRSIMRAQLRRVEALGAQGRRDDACKVWRRLDSEATTLPPAAGNMRQAIEAIGQTLSCP
ncbi:MAG: protein kinase [Gemmatimonadota bacterium]|nr:protein kinase [Gemmatimonadota bacterium]